MQIKEYVGYFDGSDKQKETVAKKQCGGGNKSGSKKGSGGTKSKPKSK